MVGTKSAKEIDLHRLVGKSPFNGHSHNVKSRKSVPMSIECIFFFNQRCPFCACVCALVIDRLNRWQLILFVMWHNANAIYLSATRQWLCAQHPHTIAASCSIHSILVPDTERMNRRLSCDSVYASSQVHSMIVCHFGHCLAWIGNCAKSDVKQDVLCAINSTPSLLWCCSCCCCQCTTACFVHSCPFFADDVDARNRLSASLLKTLKAVEKSYLIRSSVPFNCIGLCFGWISYEFLIVNQ